MTGAGGPSGRRGSVLDPWKPAIDAIVRADGGSPQRRAVSQIMAELEIDSVSHGTVASYVSALRRRARDQARREVSA